jgi:hypothetical protein
MSHCTHKKGYDNDESSSHLTFQSTEINRSIERGRAQKRMNQEHGRAQSEWSNLKNPYPRLSLAPAPAADSTNVVQRRGGGGHPCRLAHHPFPPLLYLPPLADLALGSTHESKP